MIWEHAIGIGRGPEGREHGVAFVGKNGDARRSTAAAGRSTRRRTGSTSAFASTSACGVPRQGAGNEDYHLTHVKNFLDCMRSRARPVSDVEIGHDSMIACHLGNMAQRLGRMVKWDPEKEAVIGDPEAQKMVTRPYRAPWALPKA